MHIKAALCEDNHQDRLVIETRLKHWAHLSGHQIELDIFVDTTKLLGVTDDNFEAYDLYLLDIEMRTPQEGLDFARRLRMKAEHIPIIFITSHSIFAYDSYDVHALSFVAKHQLDTPRLFAALDIMALLLKQRKNEFFTFTFEGTRKRLPLAEVYYLKADRHYLRINGDEDLRFRSKLSEVLPLYPGIFVICHQSYAVNIPHIHAIQFRRHKVVLTNSNEIPISRAQLQSVDQAFKAYHSLI